MSTDATPELSGEPDGLKPPLALIAGPTASGKSDIAVELALRIDQSGRRAVVVNADSAQVYRDLTVLSARPTSADMRGIEHRLFGEWDGAQACSAADWARRARTEIAACHAEKAVPILVGGTGMYLRTLLSGIAPIPAIDQQVRDDVRAMPVDQAYAALQSEDPPRAALLSPADTNRVARALEVIRSTGRPLAHWHARHEGGIGEDVILSAAVLLPNRDDLYVRCETRFAAMVENGALAEVDALLARGLDPDLPVMRAIGVPELAAYRRGDMKLQDACSLAAQATRNYAKRQYTWFRRQPPPEWTRYADNDVRPDAICDTLFQLIELT